jgi:hypothetical protein
MKASTVAAWVVTSTIGSIVAALSVACSSSSGGATPLTLVALPEYDGGADAGCSITGESVRVQCDTVYRITGDPHQCPGFDSNGNGTTAECQAVCMSGLVCSLSGISDGTSAVACSAGCASPEH